MKSERVKNRSYHQELQSVAIGVINMEEVSMNHVNIVLYTE